MHEEKMEFFIDPNYEYLSDFIINVPSFFDSEGETIYDVRNQIKIFKVGGITVNVKRYCIPRLFINRLAYTLLRHPKAVRAYNNALRLRSMGIDTPTPIGYLLYRDGVMLSHCYYMSVQCPYTHKIHDFEMRELDPTTERVLSEFGTFTAHLHELGIYHRDYGSGNIMITLRDQSPRFSLVDINRMDFCKIPLRKGCENFNRLALSLPQVKVVARAYAAARDFDAQRVVKNIIHFREQRKRALM